MDLWTVHVKSTHRSPFLLRNSIPDKPISWNSRKMTSLQFVEGRTLEIRVSRRNVSSGYQSLVVRAMGKKNHDNTNSSSSSSSSSSGNGDQSIPGGDGTKGNDSSSESNKSNNDTASQNSHHKTLDWREFRAALYEKEQVETVGGIGSHNQDGAQLKSKPLGPKWAHPISSPENGCVLVATEKLDGVRTFERTVVLLLRSGTRHPQEGPFGVVINRPLHKRIRHMKPTNLDLQTTFADCSLHFGGPLEASMFLLKTGGEKSQLPGFEEVVPGLCFGARNSLDEAAGLVKKGMLKPQDFKFFVGYAGWQLDQLREEIESDYWYIAACSANLIFGESTNSSSEGLWEEILQLMGGHYSELSRKPKQDM
ncbi:hypothetical protein CsSME_00048464 [Camellia sinensis var. sinensis]|uniref:Uncharacterized protein n=1 Tax=Camellia sinensis var. sinensis TaxID=542762 RepID=A0A4S4EDA2_CAMSN|nr:uncharacterized protein LOC114272802 [Camellia sinensis]THG14303.1 hypothetical protein TEA_015058 [Camellia sinensis var. sinensis]